MIFQVYIASILLAIPQLISSDKNASPVYEVINEQARIDDKIRISSSPGILPYGNPLAGKQNARIHFNNQQAMFNAERIRQLTAQLQRQARGPKLIDSYMQAYHESQDNHQLALEQQQANLKVQPISRESSHQVTQNPIKRYRHENQATQGYGSKTQRTETSRKRPESASEAVRKIERPETIRDTSRKIRPELMRITKADAKDVRYRNHRSYGSVDYHQYLEPRKYKTVYLAPGPTYDQGVTIKPNGNIGVSEESTSSKLLTEAIPSDIKYVYPKQYQQIQHHKSIQEIQANTLLTKNPQESSEYSSLSDNSNDAPIDLYFYLKNPSQVLPQSYDPYRYAQLANSYPSEQNTLDFKDYKPITEEVDDIENPDAKNPKVYIPLPTTPTKEENHKTEEVNHIYTYEDDSKKEDKPIAQTIHYYQPYYIDDKEESRKYLHHHAENTGVQHLTEDGTGVSAYGDDNVSKSKKTSRTKRSTLDTEPFSLGDSTIDDIDDKTNATLPNIDTTEPPELPSPEPLIILRKKRKNHIYVTPNPISDEDLYIPVKINKKSPDIEATYEEDYNDYDESIDYSSSNIKPIINVDTTYISPRIHQRSPVIYEPPATSYGYPLNYGSQIQKIPANFHIPTVNSFSNLHKVLEPVYMITESQLKELMSHNLNIEHLDVFQLSKQNKVKSPAHYPRRNKKRNSHRYRNFKIKNRLQKLGKLLD